MLSSGNAQHDNSQHVILIDSILNVYALAGRPVGTDLEDYASIICLQRHLIIYQKDIIRTIRLFRS